MSTDEHKDDRPAGERAALQQEIDRSHAEIGTLKRLLAEREGYIEEMRASTSWRISAPLRMVGTWLKQRGWFGRRPFEARGRTFEIGRDEYQSWLRRYSSVDAAMRERLAAATNALAARPLISLIVLGGNDDPELMRATIGSLRRQVYPHWELCIAADGAASVRGLIEREAAQDARIRANATLDLARGDYVGFIDAGDLIAEDALFWVAREISLHPELDLIFSDEDQIDRDGVRFDPFFKPAWNPALMLSQNAFGRLGAFRRSLVEKAGRFRQGSDGAAEHDLVLRCAEATIADRIRHIPRVLYHRGAPWHPAVAPGRPTSKVPDPPPLVGIVMPTTLRNEVTQRCLRSILSQTGYRNFELLLVATERDITTQRATYRDVLGDPRVRTIPYARAPFNFSWVCNLGAAQSRGPLLCFLNDDVEVTHADWLDQLVARVSLDGAGAAGPMLYYPSGLIQHAGVMLGLGGLADHTFRNLKRGQPGYFARAALEQDTSCLTAACFLVRRDLFEAVGGFDDTLPSVFNDVDLCIKLRRAGARLIWTPAAEMIHHESATYGDPNDPSRTAEFERDIALMRKRWLVTLDHDPCYNPNLSLKRWHEFELASPPRTAFASSDGALYPQQSVSRTGTPFFTLP